jgi:thioredoxin-related protein
MTRLAALALVLLPAVAQAQEPPAPATAKRPDIYDPKADTGAQLDSARKLARRDQTRILVMFGGNWCGWCHKLHDLFGSDPKIAQVLRDEYRLVMVDTEAPGAAALLDRCKAALPEDERGRVGYPFLGVLDADGQVVKAQRTDPLEVGDHHDPAKVLAFLAEFKAPPADARAILKGALETAASEDRRILLHFGAPWCGWCHRLEDFLARPEIAAIMDRDYLDVKIDVDRMEHGQEVLAEYRKGADGGIPWTIILDADGEAIVTSDGPAGNIGYPVSPEEIAHFLTMLRTSARRIEPAQIERIEAELKAAAAAIRPAAAR